MNAQSAFSVVAVFYAVANLGFMGLEILLAVPVPLVVWLALSRYLGSLAGKAGVDGAVEGRST